MPYPTLCVLTLKTIFIFKTWTICVVQDNSDALKILYMHTNAWILLQKWSLLIALCAFTAWTNRMFISNFSRFFLLVQIFKNICQFFRKMAAYCDQVRSQIKDFQEWLMMMCFYRYIYTNILLSKNQSIFKVLYNGINKKIKKSAI